MFNQQCLIQCHTLNEDLLLAGLLSAEAMQPRKINRLRCTAGAGNISGQRVLRSGRRRNRPERPESRCQPSQKNTLLSSRRLRKRRDLPKSASVGKQIYTHYATAFRVPGRRGASARGCFSRSSIFSRRCPCSVGYAEINITRRDRICWPPPLCRKGM